MPHPKGTLCLLEPRVPSNGLLVKYSHKSTQKSSETQTVSPPSSASLKTYCVLRTVLATAVLPEAHQQGLEMSPWGLHLDPHVPGRNTYGAG